MTRRLRYALFWIGCFVIYQDPDLSLTSATTSAHQHYWPIRPSSLSQQHHQANVVDHHYEEHSSVLPPFCFLSPVSRDLGIKRADARVPYDVFDLRGGAAADNESGEVEDEADEDDQEGEAESTSLTEIALVTLRDVSKRIAAIAGKVLVATVKAAKRAVHAAFEGEEAGDDETEPSAVTKIVKVLKRMWQAAVNPSSEGKTADPVTKKSSKKKKKSKQKVPMAKASEEKRKTASSSEAFVDRLHVADFGGFLAISYGVESTRDGLNLELPQILGGPFVDALIMARSQARLLFVLIPSERHSRNKRPETLDQQVIQSFLSAEVATMAEKKARKSGDTGSYLLWGAKAGSPEAVTAAKRIKAQQTNTKGKKFPILAVVYPALVVSKNTGVSKMVPQLLAQHHCSPPPPAETAAAWLNALRKRHAKQFATMQLDLREAELFKERKAGYKDSVKSDKAREEKERQEQAELEEKERAARERKEALKQRRNELRAALPQEPPQGAADAKTVSLRSADGRSAQRRFNAQTPLSTLFDWADATFEVERETVTLTTLNGQKSFSWDGDNDVSLAEAGLGRMTGLRVTTKTVEEPTESPDSVTDS